MRFRDPDIQRAWQAILRGERIEPDPERVAEYRRRLIEWAKSLPDLAAMNIQHRPQVILGGLDLGALSDNDLQALRLKLAKDLLTIHRIIDGWTDEQILAVQGDPDVDPYSIVLIQAKLNLVEVVLSRRAFALDGGR